jgi:hypothetical protein
MFCRLHPNLQIAIGLLSWPLPNLDIETGAVLKVVIYLNRHCSTNTKPFKEKLNSLIYF